MQRLKILYLCAAAPYGETYGMGLRSRNVGKLLQGLGDVSMIGIAKRPWSEQDQSETAKRFNLLRFLQPRPTSNNLLARIRRHTDPSHVDTYSLSLNEEDRAYLGQQVAAHDVTWIHTIRCANTTGIRNWSRCVLDVDDYPSQFHQTVAKNTKSPTEYVQRRIRSWTWKKREATLPDRFGSLVVCKPEDLTAFGCADRTFVVRNGFEPQPHLRASPQQLKANPRLGLIGNFDYRLNADAIAWFLEEVWSTLRRKAPSLRLRLVGRGSERYADEAAGIDGLGFVDDPAEELSTWTALIAPTRMGGGTSVKIADAFARRLPVVASSHGARGYEVENGVGILVADDAKSFADHCLKLAQDPEAGLPLAKQAYRYFEHSLAWSTMLPTVKEALEKAVSDSSA